MEFIVYFLMPRPEIIFVWTNLFEERSHAPKTIKADYLEFNTNYLINFLNNILWHYILNTELT